MSDRGHAGRLLFKAALKRVNSASPLGPSGPVSSIFSSAFVFLASEEGGSHLQNGLQPLHWFGFFVFSWQTASSVCSHRVLQSGRWMSALNFRTSIKYYKHASLFYLTRAI